MGGKYKQSRQNRRRRRGSSGRAREVDALPEPRRVEEILPEHLEPERLHVIIFGPGRGEAIVTVFPDRSVGVVDGCREPKREDGRGDPVRELLAHLDAEQPDMRIRFVCLTHPHDDHYPGLGRLIKAYEDRIDEVWRPFETGDGYAKAYQRYQELMQGDASVVGSPGLPDQDAPKGLDRVFRAMRPPIDRPRPRPKNVQADVQLVHEQMGEHLLTICGVSPSSTDLDEAQDALLRAVQEKDHRRFDPNDASGALLIRWSRAQVLLAGDLTRGRGPRCGWNSAQDSIDGKVHVVNVAHHGSEGAHHDALWDAITPNLAIVTPFQNASGNHPPRPGDIDRLLASGAQVVITSPPRWDWEHQAAPLPRPAHPDSNPVPRATSKNPRLRTVPAPGRAALRNAAAVTLDPSGRIRALLLSGAADLYSKTPA